MRVGELIEGLGKVRAGEFSSIPEGKLYEYSEILHKVQGKLERHKYARMIAARSGAGSYKGGRGRK